MLGRPDTSRKRQLQSALLSSFVDKRLQDILQPLRVTRHTIGFSVPYIHDQYVPNYVRGDTARLYDPARMDAPADPERLVEIRDALAFPRDLSSDIDDTLANLSEALDILS